MGNGDPDIATDILAGVESNARSDATVLSGGPSFVWYGALASYKLIEQITSNSQNFRHWLSLSTFLKRRSANCDP